MPKTKAHVTPKRSLQAEKEYIIVDEVAGLIFDTEADLYGYFKPSIDKLEVEYQSLRSDTDFNDEEQIEREHYLDTTLDEPDEVWEDTTLNSEYSVCYFIKKMNEGAEDFYYIASAYLEKESEVPTFVFIHFPTKSKDVMHNYQRAEMVYDRQFDEVVDGAIEGDALGEADPLAIGLYAAMITVRGEKDIPQEKFQELADLREETIEGADEIWRKNDLDGNVLVSFIKEFPDHETYKELFYIAVTQEDETSAVHSLLFSFPTTDLSLVDRYRQGENLQAEEVSQESAH